MNYIDKLPLNTMFGVMIHHEFITGEKVGGLMSLHGCRTKCTSISRGKTITKDIPNALVDLRTIAVSQRNSKHTSKHTANSNNCVYPSYKAKRRVAPLSKKRSICLHKPPKLLKNFNGITQTAFIPPDTMGAAGRLHLVSIVNDGYAVFSKRVGRKRLSLPLIDFWSRLGTKKGQPAFDPFDPRVLYDPFSRRFIAVSVSGFQEPDNPGSWLLVGISGIENPFVWRQWAIRDIGGNFIDYPALGLDRKNVYITANLFRGDTFTTVRAWVISKQNLLTQISRLTWSQFTNPKGSVFTTQPSSVFCASLNVHYLVGVKDNTRLSLNKIFFKNGIPLWCSLGSVKIDPYPDQALPPAKQKGSRIPIDTGDDRLLNAVYRKGHLWTTHHVPSDDGKRSEVAWYQIDPLKREIVQQGRIKHPQRFYYYPSIAVNKKQEVVVGFSGSSPKLFAGGFFTGRKAADPPGTMRRVSVLKKGRSSYVQFDNGRNRWGDYSATVPDPKGCSFWTLQEFAVRRQVWGTWWGNIAFRRKSKRIT